MNDEKKDQEVNLFTNPMVDSAMKALTPEQREEYKRWGEYMFTTDYARAANKTKTVENEDENILKYAEESLKSGLDPQDLSSKEIQILTDMRGIKWYEEYGYEKDEVPQASYGLTHSFQQHMKQEMANLEQEARQKKKTEKRLARKEAQKKNPRGKHKKKHYRK